MSRIQLRRSWKQPHLPFIPRIDTWQFPPGPATHMALLGSMPPDEYLYNNKYLDQKSSFLKNFLKNFFVYVFFTQIVIDPSKIHPKSNPYSFSQSVLKSMTEAFLVGCSGGLVSPSSEHEIKIKIFVVGAWHFYQSDLY